MEGVLRYVKEVLEIIVDVYLSCEESTLKLLVELTENALNIFTLLPNCEHGPLKEKACTRASP